MADLHLVLGKGIGGRFFQTHRLAFDVIQDQEERSPSQERQESGQDRLARSLKANLLAGHRTADLEQSERDDQEGGQDFGQGDASALSVGVQRQVANMTRLANICQQR